MPLESVIVVAVEGLALAVVSALASAAGVLTVCPRMVTDRSASAMSAQEWNDRRSFAAKRVAVREARAKRKYPPVAPPPPPPVLPLEDDEPELLLEEDEELEEELPLWVVAVVEADWALRLLPAS